MNKLYVTLGGYALAAIMGWLLLGAKQDLGAEIERCNTDKMTAIAEAEKIASEATRNALERRLSDLEAQARDEAEARALADTARSEAESSARDAQERIRELIREANTSESPEIACLAVDLPSELVQRLR